LICIKGFAKSLVIVLFDLEKNKKEKHKTKATTSSAYTNSADSYVLFLPFVKYLNKFFTA